MGLFLAVIALKVAALEFNVMSWRTDKWMQPRVPAFSGARKGKIYTNIEENKSITLASVP